MNGGDGSSASSSTSLTTSPSSSPFLPTPFEATLLSIYPGTLLLGSLFSILNATNRNAPYSSTTQSHVPSFAPSYFARKTNIFNVFFVKIGWFWTTLAFFAFVFSHSSLGPRSGQTLTLTPRRLHAIVRYACVTAVWTATTQWFFGPPIIDRGFRFTGGRCEVVASTSPDPTDAKSVLSHAACKAVGGAWKGGHDISGHVFILILGSAMLWLEILPAVLRASGLREERRIRTADGKVRSAAAETLEVDKSCLLYTSPSPRDRTRSRMPSSA